MSAYEHLLKVIRDAGDNEDPEPTWRYVGPGYGQRIVHNLVILEPDQAVTCSMGYGFLGSCEEFMLQFELVA